MPLANVSEESTRAKRRTPARPTGRCSVSGSLDGDWAGGGADFPHRVVGLDGPGFGRGRSRFSWPSLRAGG